MIKFVLVKFALNTLIASAFAALVLGLFTQFPKWDDPNIVDIDVRNESYSQHVSSTMTYDRVFNLLHEPAWFKYSLNPSAPYLP